MGVGLCLVALGCAGPASHTADAAAADAGTDAGCSTRTCITAVRAGEAPLRYRAGWWHGFFSEGSLFGGVSADDLEDAVVCDRVEQNPVDNPSSWVVFVVWGPDETGDLLPDPGVFPVFGDYELAEANPEERSDRPRGAYVEWGRLDGGLDASTSGSVHLIEVERGGRLVIEIDASLGGDLEVRTTGQAEIDYCIPPPFDA